jgi:hypothetical protein
MGGPSPFASEGRFSKRVNFIPSMDLGHSLENQKSIILSKHGLVGKFLGLWPNP